MPWLTALVIRLRHQSGQSLAEYGLIVASIAVVVILTAALLGVNITGMFSKSSTGL